jgi:hypothetical protein
VRQPNSGPGRPGKLRDLAVGGGDRGGDQRDGAGVEGAQDGAQVDGDGGVAEAGGDPQDGLLGGGARQQPAVQGVQGGVPADGGEGWPVLMLVPVVMARRKAPRCRKCPWLMIRAAAAVSAGTPSAASRSWQVSSGTPMAVAFMVC